MKYGVLLASIVKMTLIRADSRLAPSQWETSLQSNAISQWLGASLKSALLICRIIKAYPENHVWVIQFPTCIMIVSYKFYVALFCVILYRGIISLKIFHFEPVVALWTPALGTKFIDSSIKIQHEKSIKTAACWNDWISIVSENSFQWNGFLRPLLASISLTHWSLQNVDYAKDLKLIFQGSVS